MKLKFKYILLGFVLVFLVAFLGTYTGIKIFGQPSTDSGIPTKNNISDEEAQQILANPSLQKVLHTFQLIQQSFIEEVDEEELYEGAIKGMLDVLDDPHSEYMDIEVMERFEEQIDSSFEGIGAEVTLWDGKVTIVSPIKDSPAEKAGLRPNDIILEVDGKSLEGLELYEAVEHIRGEKGSEVVISIQRGSSTPFDITLVRDDIPIETVYKEIFTDGGKKTGYLAVTSFSNRTGEEFAAFLEELENENMDGLIIDVRGNPGGRLDVVENMLEHFIPKDKPYIQIEGRNGEKDVSYTKTEAKKPYPINILIDEGSASASEILAVALKENGYDVIGTTSFGKGTVQQTVPLGDGSTVKLTFYKWLSPDGNWIDEVGVEPTIEQAQPDYFYLTPVQIEEPFKIDEVDEKIAIVQKMMKGLGYDNIRLDGYFDEEMATAIKDLQQKNGIEVSGQLDSETYSKIELEIIDLVRDPSHDKQLDKAKEVLYK